MSSDSVPTIPAQAVRAIWLLRCTCGSEWIDAVDPDANEFSPSICGNCGKAGYIDATIQPLYVRGVVLDGPPAAASETVAPADSP